MESKKIDRRIKKTKTLIRKAILELMEEKDIKNITITDLSEKADINRGTFYLHYKDTNDLINEIENEVLNEVSTIINKSVNDENIKEKRPTILLKFLEYFYINRDIAKILLSDKGYVSFQEKLKNLMGYGFIDFLNKAKIIKVENEDYEFFAAFITSGMIGIIREWIKSDFKKSPNEIAAFMKKIY